MELFGAYWGRCEAAMATLGGWGWDWATVARLWWRWVVEKVVTQS